MKTLKRCCRYLFGPFGFQSMHLPVAVLLLCLVNAPVRASNLTVSVLCDGVDISPAMSCSTGFGMLSDDPTYSANVISLVDTVSATGLLFSVNFSDYLDLSTGGPLRPGIAIITYSGGADGTIWSSANVNASAEGASAVCTYSGCYLNGTDMPQGTALPFTLGEPFSFDIGGLASSGDCGYPLQDECGAEAQLSLSIALYEANGYTPVEIKPEAVTPEPGPALCTLGGLIAIAGLRRMRRKRS
jgi:hypothetical protein